MDRQLLLHIRLANKASMQMPRDTPRDGMPSDPSNISNLGAVHTLLQYVKDAGRARYIFTCLPLPQRRQQRAVIVPTGDQAVDAWWRQASHDQSRDPIPPAMLKTKSARREAEGAYQSVVDQIMRLDSQGRRAKVAALSQQVEGAKMSRRRLRWRRHRLQRQAMRLGMVPGGLPDESDSESEIEEEGQVESAGAEPFVTVETEPEQSRAGSGALEGDEDDEKTEAASEQAEADPLVTVAGVGAESGLGSCSDVSSSSSASSRLSSSGSVSVSNPADPAPGAGVPPMLPELALPQSPIAPADIAQTLSRWTGTMRDIARAANTTLVRRLTANLSDHLSVWFRFVLLADPAVAQNYARTLYVSPFTPVIENLSATAIHSTVLTRLGEFDPEFDPENSALSAVVSPHMVRLELRHGDSVIGQLAGPELRPRFNFPLSKFFAHLHMPGSMIVTNVTRLSLLIAQVECGLREAALELARVSWRPAHVDSDAVGRTSRNKGLKTVRVALHWIQQFARVLLETVTREIYINSLDLALARIRQAESVANIDQTFVDLRSELDVVYSEVGAPVLPLLMSIRGLTGLVVEWAKLHETGHDGQLVMKLGGVLEALRAVTTKATVLQGDVEGCVRIACVDLSRGLGRLLES
ncbi:hypothetical protein J8273_2596 [Carpediemonas membranifera]|uniref:Uncharacterized protein n=1 Tax=Carpediemonas membranifera TaxID=201153 RepID=A0A8J6B855_9EUKA|nr:hypothetical protein J8273_2596 [Carpediemonas membranifera]|eukprot:KAG9396244.1 hypothetical protein J8273_2596 [Carpediemonas membranifera]